MKRPRGRRLRIQVRLWAQRATDTLCADDRQDPAKPRKRWAVMAAALVTVVGFPLLLVSVWFAYHLDVIISQQLGEIKRIAQSENSIALNTMVFNDYSNADIIGTIQNDKPLLVANGGKYTSVDLDKYLGAFNTVALVY